MDSSDKYYTDDSNDRPYWIAEEYFKKLATRK